MRNTKQRLRCLTGASQDAQFRSKFSGFFTGVASVFLALLISSSALAAPLPSEGYVVGDIFKTDISAYDANNKDKLTSIMKMLVNGKINILCVCYWWCMPCDMLTKLMVGGVGSLNEFVKTERQLLKQVGLSNTEIAAYEARYGDQGFDVSGADYIRAKYASWALPGVVFPGNFTGSTSFLKDQIHDIELIGLAGNLRPSNRFEALGYRTFNSDAKNSLMHSNINAPFNPSNFTASFGPVEAFANKVMMGLYQDDVVFTTPNNSPGFPTEIVMDKDNRIVGIMTGRGELAPGLKSGKLEDNNKGGYFNDLLHSLTDKSNVPISSVVQALNFDADFVTQNSDVFGASQSAAMLAKLDQAKQRIQVGNRASAAASLQDFWTLLRARLGAHVNPSDNNSPLISSVGEGPSKAYMYTTAAIKQLQDTKLASLVKGTLDTAEQVTGTGTSGSRTFTIGFGYTGNFVANMHGLNGDVQTGVVNDDPNQLFPAPATLSQALALGNVVSAHQVVLPAGTLLGRIRTSDATTTGNSDLDMWLYRPNGNLLIGSYNAGPVGEGINLFSNLPNGETSAATFTVVMYGWDTGGPAANFTLYTSVASTAAANAGNATVTAPNSASAGSFADVTVSWTGLAPGRPYLGVITYEKDGVIIGKTIIDINTGYVQ